MAHTPYFETVCFDLDDTLIANTYKYHAPIWRCGLMITEALGIDSVYPKTLMETRIAVDQGLVKELGFSVERFPRSWIVTYERLCAQLDRKVDRQLCMRLYDEAKRFAEGPFTPLEGAEDCLRLLKASGRRLCLITAGDEGLQRRKIDESGLEPHFDTVVIVERSKKPFLGSERGEDPARTMMVGDSLRSDITPAIELGMTPVHVESQTWHFAHTEVEGDYHAIASVRELVELIGRLEAEAETR